MSNYRLLPNWVRRGLAAAICSGWIASFFTPALAQISVVFPTPRTVVQRNNVNQAQLWVVGQCPPNTTRVEVFLSATVPGGGLSSTAYTVLDANPANGRFRGQVQVQGGWYHLNVRAMQEATVLETIQITPVGVGEVFAIAGQSNGQGIVPNKSTVAASDERIVRVPHYNGTDTIRLPLPPYFDHISADGVIGPRGLTGWCWSILGDSLAKRLNVPVAFFNTAWSGTAVRNWRESITQDSTATSYGEFFRPKMPYANLKRVLQDYVALTGVRAVLWHQGEAEYYDIDPMAPNYYNDLRFVIAQSRTDAAYAELPWMVARASIDMFTRTLYSSNRYEPVWNQQNQVIQTTHKVFFGPDTDPLDIPRADAVHFSGPGLVQVANAWNASMTSDFFNAATPLSPQSVAPTIDLELSGSVSRRVLNTGEDILVTLTLANTGKNTASGIRIRCQLPNSLSCTNAGGFTLHNGQLLYTLTDNLTPGGRTTLPFVVRPLANGTFRLAAEIIRSDQLDEDSRPNTSFADGQDDMTWIDFRTLATSEAIFEAPISQNAVLLPNVTSNQPNPDPNKADLSLQIVTNILVASIGQPVQVSMSVTNRGGSAASNVLVQCLLPASTGAFSSSSMHLNGQTASGTITSIPAGESATIWFQVSGNAAGNPVFMAQIGGVSIQDSDSAPNNGYTNGEDDTAQVGIRVR